MNFLGIWFSSLRKKKSVPSHKEQRCSLFTIHAEFGVAKCHLKMTLGGIWPEQHFLLKLGLQLSDGKDAAAGNKMKMLPFHHSPLS